MKILAIDPGVTGALALVTLSDGGPICEWVADMPTVSETLTSGKVRRWIDAKALHKLVKTQPADLVVCEKLFAPPGIASTTAFSMGASKGTIESVLALAGRRLELVAPSVWKRAIECPPDKQAARRFATKVFGGDAHWKRAMDHNRAEAALIGWHMLRVRAD